MIELSPSKLLEFLKNRVSSVNRLKTSIGEKKDDVSEIEKNIYFQYYFCFSTAIEETIYNIIIQKYDDPFVMLMMKIENKSISKYVNLEEAKKLIGDFGEDITFNDVREFYCGFGDIINDKIFRQQPLKNKLYSKYKFEDVYKSSRNTRNMLAHGLVLQNVKYEDRILFDFMCSFYILHKYHEFLHR